MVLSATTTQNEERTIVDVVDSMDPIFLIFDKNFNIIRVNKAYEKETGAKREDVIGKSIWELFPLSAKHDSPYWINYHYVMKTKKPAKFVAYNELRENQTEVFAYPTKEGGVAVFVRDITEKLNAARALEESEKRFRALVNANSENVLRISPDWSELRMLDNSDQISSKGRVIHDWLEKYVHPHDKKQLKSAIEKAIKTKGVFNLEHRVIQPDGTTVWLLSRAIPVTDEKGNIIEWFGSATDITARKRSEEVRQRQLATEQRMKLVTEQRNALLKINKTKDEFIALASHQLRTPATIVKQYTGLLLKEFTGSLAPEQRKFLQIIYKSNERELEIINDLLKTAQIDGSGYVLNVDKHDVIELVKSVIGDLKATLEQRDQHVEFHCQRKHLKLLLDATEMKLAISNLMENASKYSPAGSKIKVSIVPIGKGVDISISDKGIGISKENHVRVFEKFTRISNEFSDSVPGTGLGLYWVKQIAEAHDGSIKLDSTPGKGSTFTMRLPL